MDILIVAALLVLSLLMLFKPELVCRVESSVMKRGEPVEGYRVVMRMIGAFFFLFALMAGFYLLIK